MVSSKALPNLRGTLSKYGPTARGIDAKGGFVRCLSEGKSQPSAPFRSFQTFMFYDVSDWILGPTATLDHSEVVTFLATVCCSRPASGPRSSNPLARDNGGFLKMGVPPNYPFIDGFSMKNHPAIGVPPF